MNRLRKSITIFAGCVALFTGMAGATVFPDWYTDQQNAATLNTKVGPLVIDINFALSSRLIFARDAVQSSAKLTQQQRNAYNTALQADQDSLAFALQEMTDTGVPLANAATQELKAAISDYSMGNAILKTDPARAASFYASAIAEHDAGKAHYGKALVTYSDAKSRYNNAMSSIIYILGQINGPGDGTRGF